MRVGVIRGDLPGALRLTDMETLSQYNPPTEPAGQERYIGRPTTDEIEAVLAHPTRGAGAVIEGSDIAGNFPITIDSSNDDLRVKTSAAAAFTTVLIAQDQYANLTTFLAAINAALTGTGVTARQGTGSGQRVALESNTKGVTSYIEIDSTANGSVANTPLGLDVGGSTRTMPAASAFIAALNPVNGALDVSTTTINGVGATTNANALSLIPTSRGTHTAIADAIAPLFYETSVAIDSFLVGMLSKYRSSSYNPDSKRLPNGAAVAVVQNDGATPFAAGLPAVTLVSLNVPNAGDITISGTGLGSFDSKDTVVGLTNPTRRIDQRVIEQHGGSVSSTSIVIPASLAAGASFATQVRVQVRQRVSAPLSVDFGALILSENLAVTEDVDVEVI